MKSVGRSIPHDSATGHVTGSAFYVEDHPLVDGELWVDFVGAPTAAGRLVSIDTSDAESIPGVRCVLTHHDIPGVNHFGPIFQDEAFLCEDEILYWSQPVVVIGAESRAIARRARESVRINVQTCDPILTIDEAVEAASFLGPRRTIECGDVEKGFAESTHVIERVFRSGGQEQFYLESQACRVMPGEDHQLLLECSTQNPTETQAVVAEVLGLQMHDIVCQCKRMGGGFGGKETQSALPALMASLVASHTGQPARIVYRKDTDMLGTGKRHAYRSRYRIGFDEQGQIRAADFEFHSDGGAYADLSTSVLERTMLHADNAYFLPNVRIVGQVCKTNYPPNTAFRGFGGPQGIVVIENALQEIAQILQMDAWDVRQKNLYRDGDPSRNQTPYGQEVKNHVLPEMFRAIETSSDYRNRVQQIAKFNQNSQTHVKGIAGSAVKFGISFTSRFLNQGNALVNVFTDGSVQVSTGGTEMGQGLNTKIRQLVADELSIDPENVRLMTTSTEKNNNTSPTAASAGTDLNGTAAVQASQQIRNRLMKFAAELASQETETPVKAESLVLDQGHVRAVGIDGSWKMGFAKLCDRARRERIDLGERAHYATPGVDFDRDTGKGTPFYYFTSGVAISEVTIDRFTGSKVVDRVDLLMDIGRMINPGVDVGQVIGGFVQGMGWCTDEELVYDEHGILKSTGPTTYKIPAISDLPKRFEYAFHDNPKHTLNVRQSKAVGEPPLMLGISVWLAIKNAMSSLTPDRLADLKVPATGEEILHCMTDLSHPVDEFSSESMAGRP